ncbi:hypothetical protein GCM10020256_46330 [Streptomyces thermocoprophilus]
MPSGTSPTDCVPHRRAACSGGAAAEALELARELARRAQSRESPEAEPREMPDAGMFAAADQVTVAGRDLAVVLRSDTEVEEAVRLVEEARQRAGI